MIEFNTLLNVVSTELTRSITGRLFTDDQIRAVTSNVVGKYFADWLPKVGADKAAHDRVEEARSHIEMASSIITAMQGELNAQTGQLDKLLVEIEGRRNLRSGTRNWRQRTRSRYPQFKGKYKKVSVRS
jgi:hypothetical protein